MSALICALVAAYNWGLYTADPVAHANSQGYAFVAFLLLMFFVLGPSVDNKKNKE